MDTMNDRLVIAGREFQSRLWVGTGKYKDFAETKKAIDASGADVVTVAVRRVNITDRSKENLLDYLDPKKYIILPNTAGCYTVEDAVRYARLARAAGVSDLVKLEVIGDDAGELGPIRVPPPPDGLCLGQRSCYKKSSCKRIFDEGYRPK